MPASTVLRLMVMASTPYLSVTGLLLSQKMKLWRKRQAVGAKNRIGLRRTLRVLGRGTPNNNFLGSRASLPAAAAGPPAPGQHTQSAPDPGHGESIPHPPP